MGKEDQLQKEKMLFSQESEIFRFVIITLVTICFYFINIPLDMVNIKNNVLYAFAIYLAFDRLYNKWQKIQGQHTSPSKKS